MTRLLRHGMILLGLAAVFGAAGCSKQGNAQRPADPGGEAPAGAAGEGTASDAVADPASFSLFPADSEFVFGLDFAGVRESALWKAYRQPLLGVLAEEQALAQFQNACGTDLISELESIRIGGPSTDEDRLTFIVKGFRRDQVDSCARALAEREEHELEIKGEGNLVHYSDEQDGVWLAWLDERTFLTGNHEDRAWFEKRMSGEDGLEDDAPLVSLIDSEVEKRGAWFGTIPAAEGPFAEGLATAGGPEPEAIFGSVVPSEGLRVDVGVRFASAALAEQTRQGLSELLPMLKMQMGQLGGLVDKIDMSTADSDMLVQVALSEKELRDLASGLAAVAGRPTGNAQAEALEEPPSGSDMQTLVDACTEGDMEACDELYRESPVRSDEETWGDTCGGRQAPGTDTWCVETADE